MTMIQFEDVYGNLGHACWTSRKWNSNKICLIHALEKNRIDHHMWW